MIGTTWKHNEVGAKQKAGSMNLVNGNILELYWTEPSQLELVLLEKWQISGSKRASAAAVQRSDVLPVNQVESSEQGVVLRGGPAALVLVQEDGRASHLHAQLLDALLVVDRQQEGLEAWFGTNRGQDGEVLRENSACRRRARTDKNGFEDRKYL